MPNYSVSVKSADNILIAKEAIKSGKTIEKFLADLIKDCCIEYRSQNQ